MSRGEVFKVILVSVLVSAILTGLVVFAAVEAAHK
jgi:hypothetical protein